MNKKLSTIKISHKTVAKGAKNSKKQHENIPSFTAVLARLVRLQNELRTMYKK